MTLRANLATRPFRNERGDWALALALALGVAALSVWHVRVVRGLLAGQEAAAVQRVRAAEARIDAIARDLKENPPVKAPASDRARFAAYKEIVDRREFSWRALLSALEGLVPPDVRLTQISPRFDVTGSAPIGTRAAATLPGATIRIEAEARTKEAVFGFAEALETSDAFAQARISRLQETEGRLGVQLDVAVSLPAALAAAAPSAAPASASPASASLASVAKGPRR